MKNVFFKKTPLGRIGVAENGVAVTNIFWGTMVKPSEYEICETQLITETFRQLAQYFDGKRKVFDLPLEPEGNGFERTVWNALLEIPCGQTRSYKEIAERIGKPKAARAVGGANSRNPIGIVIPCHRVIGSNNKLTGYAGGGITVKQYLLELEQGKQ